MKRGAYAKVKDRNAPLLKRIREIKADHPFWGYRRIWAHLRFVDEWIVGKNRVYRMMKTNGLLVKPNLRLKAKRKASRPKPRPTRPNEWWGIDMTKVMLEDFGWVYVVIVLDWRTKKVVGHYAGLQAKTWHWLSTLNKVRIPLKTATRSDLFRPPDPVNLATPFKRNDAGPIIIHADTRLKQVGSCISFTC